VGGQLVVRLGNDANGIVVVDGVRIKRVSPLEAVR
jgi:hypothetical protein